MTRLTKILIAMGVLAVFVIVIYLGRPEQPVEVVGIPSVNEIVPPATVSFYRNGEPIDLTTGNLQTDAFLDVIAQEKCRGRVLSVTFNKDYFITDLFWNHPCGFADSDLVMRVAQLPLEKDVIITVTPKDADHKLLDSLRSNNPEKKFEFVEEDATSLPWRALKIEPLAGRN